MKRKSYSSLIFFFLIVGGVTLFSLMNSENPEYYFEGNVRSFSLQQLSLVQSGRNMDCDGFNQISVTYDDDVYKTLANGRDGITPFIDSAIPLDLSQGGKDVKQVHFEFALVCDGNAMEGSTVVKGTLPTRICGDPAYAGTTCIVGEERFIERFDNLAFANTQLNEDELKVVHRQTFSEGQLNSFFNTGSGTIFFKHESFPILTFTFIHPTAGSFSATYNAQTENSKVIAQYGLIENFVASEGTVTSSTDTSSTVTTPTTTQTPDQTMTVNENDSDADGFPNDVDQCPNEGETFNSYQDDDGCPDLLPEGKGLAINYWSPQILDTSRGESTITVGIGIQDLGPTELAPTLKVLSSSGFVKEEIVLPDECINRGSFGWIECEFSFVIDKDRYPEGSYKLSLSSESRLGVVVSVPLEVVDQTRDLFSPDRDIDLADDPNLTDNQKQDLPEKIINFITGKQTTSTTSSGVKITRSTQSSDFGSDDIVILATLMGITGSIGLLAKYRKKLR